jgi:[glutamine synthetase] adenylyltransferase / [glutamine synthetase]-adenylyl-L-tyrosine phosphorylase
MTSLPALFSQHLPENLQAEGGKVSASLLSSLEDKMLEQLLTRVNESPMLAPQLVRALVGSQYIVDSVCRYPELLLHWLLVDTPYAPLSAVRIVEMAALACECCETPEQLNKTLRQLRRRMMVAIVWRDLNGLSDFAEVCQSMTAMAEVLIQQAVDFHYRQLSSKHGLPIGQESQVPQPLLVVGMGKLGGAELNVSSDIDLLFVFPESGETDHVTRPLDNQQFFIRLGQLVIKSLNEPTVDGFVFRVDMRLRPYGQSGPLVSSFAALEHYYATQGRDWERFAGIKARVVACSALVDPAQSLLLAHQAKAELADILLPFVYRKYTDFSVIESLRQLKAIIAQEVRRKGMETNVKLGAGGIRELEFIVQTFQLIRGGREWQLQERHWLTVMAQLAEDDLFDEGVAEDLCDAYRFLRKTEHALQAYKDEQTQALPEDTRTQAILAWAMGFANWDDFSLQLAAYRQRVSEQFQLVIADPQDKSAQVVIDEEWLALWLGRADDGVRYLTDHGCEQAPLIVQQLDKLRNSWSVRQLSASSRESLDALMPQLLATTVQLAQADTTLLRMLTWLEKIVGRSSYITLMLENPSVLRHLAVLFEGSVWIAELLAQMPALMDELLSAESLYHLPSKAELQSELRIRLLRVEPDDVETTMEVLRYFKLSHSLRVAASELAGGLALMNVSDYLTWIAEVVLEQVLVLAWHQLRLKHGVPSGVNKVHSAEGIDIASSGFAIVAYGKLGGIELSYSSDLDLVFVYQADANAMTNGDKPIESQTFYIRLGQKIIHLLNMRTLSGPLYEVDMRLRPSGNSGLLATSMEAFSRYQLQEAWTWEHQALVRARPVVGDAFLMTALRELRQQVLASKRSPIELKQAVVEMRQKMRNHLGSSTSGKAAGQENSGETPLFHLKQDAGGIVDIEFMVQYAVLAWAVDQLGFAEYTDNIRILEYWQSSGCDGAEQAPALIAIYKAYREVMHRLALQKQSSLIALDQFSQYQLADKRQQIQEVWQHLFGV